MLIGHNEDWSADAANSLCIVKKQLPDSTIFELLYYHTLGGNAISINSHGFVQAINSLTHADSQMGLPGNSVAHWLSHTQSPESDFNKMEFLTRATGYSHTLVNNRGKLWNIEASATKQILENPASPYVHTNHYISKLLLFEKNTNDGGSWNRYDKAMLATKPRMSVEEMQNLLSDALDGKEKSIYNKRTIAQVVIDLLNLEIHILLLREKKLGWVTYPLDFIKSTN